MIDTAIRERSTRPPKPARSPGPLASMTAWFGDQVARLDPTPLLAWWQDRLEPLSVSFGRAMEAPAAWIYRISAPESVCGRARSVIQRAGLAAVPVAAGFERWAAVLATRHRRFARAAERGLGRLPLPGVVREVLWLGEAPRASEPGARTVQARMRSWHGPVVWTSIVFSVGIHAFAFAYSPVFDVEDVSFEAVELSSVEIPPEVEVPPPPSQVSRPATPVISDLPLDEDITIAPTTFEENPVDELPPPPSETGSRIEAAGSNPSFTPFTVAPEIRNRQEVVSLITSAYPASLRDAGIGGVVLVWFYIDEAGRVGDTRIAESSGFPALDNAALEVSDRFVFSPALLNDQNVPVWVQFPITFSVR